MQNETKRKLTIGVLYLTIALFSVYIFVMFLLNGVEWAPMVKGKMENPNFSLTTWKWFFYPHLLFGTIALAIGPFQLTKISYRKPKLHKMLGKIYATAIFINILVVPYISLSATGGRNSTIAFLVLNAFWLWTTSMGVIKATRRKIREHKVWILRSYAITWVFVTFRLVVIPFAIFLESSVAFPLAVYLSITLNLLFVEWKRKKSRKHSSGPKISTSKPVI